MQKHNKYLIVTIWIATIAFIGAGFVGWGSYQYGAKAGTIAKVGNIDISKEEFDFSYGTTYQKYNQMLKGQLDEKKAKEIGIAQQTFSTLAREALLLNLAQEFGIVVNDEEVLQELYKIPSFQTKKVFDKSVYQGYLKSQRLKAKTFEAVIHKELVVQKLLKLLASEGFKFEDEIVMGALSVSDKVAYRVLDKGDIVVDNNLSQLQAYWQKNKSQYKTNKQYQLDILWTDTEETNVTASELEEFYGQNSFNYIDRDGKQLSLESAKEQVTRDLKMKKSKKHAQKQYIAYKKGKIEKSETKTVDLNDALLTDEIWKLIVSKDINTILKPKVIGNKYATIKIVAIIEPREMQYEEARALVERDYKTEYIKNSLNKLADRVLENFNENNATISDFVTLNTQERLRPLNSKNSSEFLQKLFTSQKEKGIISINNKTVVYKILEQKILLNEDNMTKAFVKNSVNQIKNQDFQSNLLKFLGQKYQIEKFVEGI